MAEGQKLKLVAVGNVARGVFAFGNVAQGIVAVGNVAHGVVSIGMSLSVGAVAIGCNALGGVAIGLNAVGVVSLSAINGVGLLCWAGVNGLGTVAVAGVNLSDAGPVGWIFPVLALGAALVFRGSRRPRTPSGKLVTLAALRSGEANDGWVRGAIAPDGDGIATEGGRVEAPAHLVDAAASSGPEPVLLHVFASSRAVPDPSGDYRSSHRTERVLGAIEIAPTPPSWLRPIDPSEITWWFARALATVAIAGVAAAIVSLVTG